MAKATRVGAKKKVAKKKATKKAAPRRRRRGEESLGLSLPTEAKKADPNFFNYVTLVYGRPGIGKSTLMASFPDAMLFSCERVSAGIECFDFNSDNGGVHSWEVFREGVKLLLHSDRFKTICIDTVQAAYTMCSDYVCRSHGISHPGDERYGKGWSAVRDEFCGQLDAIAATGRGIVFASHAKEVEITSHSGDKYTKIQPSISGQAFEYIKQKTDFVFYAEYVKDMEGHQRRVLFTTGDEVIDAKHAGTMPRYLPFEKEGGANIIQRCFAGEDLGIAPELIRPDKQTSASGTDSLRKDRANAKLKNARAKAGKTTKKKVARRRK